MKKVIIAAFAITAIGSACKNSTKSSANLNNGKDSLAYAIGVSIANDIGTNFDSLNYDIIAKAILDVKDSAATMDADAADQVIRSEMQKIQMEKQKKAEAEGEVNKVAGEKFLEENKSKQGVMVSPSGLQYKVTQEGKGAKPDANDRVTVHYHGTTIDGKVFDSSVERGQPATFLLNQVIPGWTEGLQLLKEGGKATLYIPQSLAYGARGAGGAIAPYSALVFEVELIKVEPVQ